MQRLKTKRLNIETRIKSHKNIWKSKQNMKVKTKFENQNAIWKSKRYLKSKRDLKAKTKFENQSAIWKPTKRLENHKIASKYNGLEERSESCVEELAQHAEEFVGGHGVGSFVAAEFLQDAWEHACVEDFCDEFGCRGV